MPRKRGRPSKKAKLEEEIMRRERQPQKRVRIADGVEHVSYQSGAESEDDRAASELGEEKDKQNQEGQEVAPTYRSKIETHEDYVKMINSEHN